METKHTPGPWNLNGFTRIEGKPGLVCNLVMPGEFMPKAEYEANARLIAAAPELLKALEFTLKALYATDCPSIPDGAMVKGKIYNAISKAKGE